MTTLCSLRLTTMLLAALIAQVRTADSPKHLHGEHSGRDFSGPVVQVTTRAVDLGLVREGEKPTATFEIQNLGAKDLIIEDVRTTCGCTTVELSDEERIVKPQESRKIVAIFDSKGRVGKQRKPVIVKVNDPEEPQLTLTLVAEVVSLFKVLPSPMLNLRSARRGVELDPLEVFPVDKNAVFESLDVEVPDDILEYRREDITSEENGKGVRLTFKVPDHAEIGPIGGHVELFGQVAGEKAQVPVRIAGIVVGDLVARPALLQSLGEVPRGHTFAPVTIAATNDLPFELISASAGPYIDVTFEAAQQGKAYIVRTKIRADAPDGPLGVNLTIRTNNTGQPLVTVPMFVNVRARFLVEPAIVLLGPDAGRTRKVALHVDARVPLKVTRVSCDNPQVVAQTEGVDAELPGGIAFVRVGVRPDSTPETDITTEVVVETNIPEMATIRIPVEYHVDG